MTQATSSERNNWDSLIVAELERFLARYQAMEIWVGDHQVRVHVPYMLGSVTWVDQPETLSRQRPRHQARLIRVAQARATAPPALQAFFRRWFYEPDGKEQLVPNGAERLVAAGRAGPEDIRQLVQAAVDAALVPSGQGPLTGMVLRAWMVRYGIGVDCSAFVQHTLTHLIRASYAAIGEMTANPQETAVGWMRGPTVQHKLLENAPDRRFDLVAVPAQARPGDILNSTDHTRIIVEAQPTPENALLVTLAESTSRTDQVAGTHLRHDVGPRLYHVLYPNPDRPIPGQIPLHKRTAEAAFEFEPSEWEQQYLIARNRKLAAFHQQHPPPP